MKFKVAILFLMIFVSGCRKGEINSDRCNPENPLEMQWMADWVGELHHCTCIISIFQAEFNGETVFWALMNDPLCQSVITDIEVYNCFGEQILTLNNYEDWTVFNSEVTDLKIIYACPKN